MKQIKHIAIIAVAAALLAACTKEMNAPEEQSVSSITASLAESQTKTVLGEDGTSILWSPNDEISVFYNGDGVKFTSINSVPKDRTIFMSSYSLIYGGAETSSDPYLYAIYPYSSDNAQDGEYLTLTVPASQTAVEGSFARGTYPSVGRSNDTNIAFYNVCGGICFSVTNSGIKKVVFSGLNNENLAGKVKVAFDQNGEPVVTQTMIGETELVLNVPDGETLETGKLYYISSLPTMLSSGFKMVLYTSSKHATLTSSSAAEIKRSIFGTLKNADAGLLWEDGGTVVTRVITATFNEGGTKTSLSETTGQLVWDDGQKVFLFDGEKTDTPVIDKQSDQMGTLTTNAMDNPTVLGGIPSEYFLSNDGSAICSVHPVQDGTFNSSCIALAKTGAENTLSFSPATAVIKLQITGEFDSLRFSTTGPIIAGTCNVDYAGDPSLSSPFESASSSIMLKPATTQSGVYYIGILPCTTDGLNIEIYKHGASAIKTSTESAAFNKGTISVMTINISDLTFFVDLGLSVKWATCNIGASQPQDYGKYFAWGDVVGQTWNGSAWSGGGFSYQTYEVDENNNLKPAYDAAHVNLGGSWRMPTKAEQQELIDYCTTTWTTNYNGTWVAGRIFTSNKEGYTDKSIFLPAAGYASGTKLIYAEEYGNYWSSTFNGGDAWQIDFCSGYFITNDSGRRAGQSVRPVTE